MGCGSGHMVKDTVKQGEAEVGDREAGRGDVLAFSSYGWWIWIWQTRDETEETGGYGGCM